MLLSAATVSLGWAGWLGEGTTCNCSMAFDILLLLHQIWNKDEPYRPIYARWPHCGHLGSLGWIFDAHWDPMGCGVYCSGSDVPCVWWDSPWLGLGGISANTKTRVTLYSHSTRHGGVWKVLSIGICFEHD